MASTNNRFSVGSLASLGSFPGGVSGADVSFISMASSTSTVSSSFEIESEVGREAVKEICCSALSRILDFPDDQLEVLLGYDEDDQESTKESGMNVARNIAASFRIMKRALSHKQHHPAAKYLAMDKQALDEPPTLTFGGPLHDKNQYALSQLIDHLHNFVSSQGLFRKPGNKHRMESLIAELECKSPLAVVSNTKYNAHDYASVLKKYFSELSEPLLMKRHLDAYLQTAGLTSPSSRVCCLQLLMLLLSPTNRAVLQSLLDLLSEVARQPENLMDAQNLGLVFAPTLFLASKHEMLGADSLTKLSSLLKLMIEKPDEIFEVPVEVQVVAEKYLQRKRTRASDSIDSLDAVDGDDSMAIDIYSTSCQRADAETFHQTGQENAAAEVDALFEMVKNMPDGPQKTHFLKRFESASKMKDTPKVYTKFKKVSKSTLKKQRKNKENATPAATPATPRVRLPMPVGSDSVVKFPKKGSLLDEFDLVDNRRPYGNSENTASAIKTMNKYKVKVLPTMSPLVTDV